MSTSGLLGWLNIRGIECEISFSDEIYSNCPTLVTLSITNRKRFIHSYLLTINALDKKLLITSVPRCGTVKTSFIHTFGTRGRHLFDASIISSPFPVNFFVRGMELPADTEIFVFPAPARTGGTLFRNFFSPQGELLVNKRGSDGDILTIADYTGVEPLRQIHWRLSARHDWFKVKETGSSANDPVIIDLSATNSFPVEDKLAKAVFLINRLGRENRMFGLKITPERVIPANRGRNHRLGILKELALY